MPCKWRPLLLLSVINDGSGTSSMQSFQLRVSRHYKDWATAVFRVAGRQLARYIASNLDLAVALLYFFG